MTETPISGAQVAPNATTESAAYTAPALTSAVLSTISVCNRGAVAGTFRISISAGGGVTANKDYLFYNQLLGPTDAFEITKGLTMKAGDVVRVYASTADFSFGVFGIERS